MTGRRQQTADFIKATAEGYKRYLADPAPGNTLIKKENPDITDAQLAFTLARLEATGLVTGGDARTLGIGVITDAREAQSYNFLVAAKLIDPAKVALSQTYTTSFVRDIRVLP